MGSLPFGSTPGIPSGARAADGGERVLRVRRPGDGAFLAEVPVTEPAEVARMVERARVVQVEWGAVEAGERVRRLRALGAAIARRADDLVRVIRDETGKPEAEALAELVGAAEPVRFYARHAPRVLRPRRVSPGFLVWKKTYVVRVPYGVVGVISPWNYPFLLAMDPLVAALFCGNAVVLKPSEATPLTGLAVGEVCRAAGLPAELVQVAPGDGRTGEALVRAGVDKIFLTGSPATGRAVMRAAAETLTPVALELGGKDAALVLGDADLERAARGIVFGAFYNAGQTCVSVERVYVVETVHDAFVERVRALTLELRVGAGDDVDVGPMVLESQIAVVEEHVADAVRKGARVLVGGRRREGARQVYEPTVLVGVDHTMRVAREETFGPVLPVICVRDEKEAVALANESPYGLQASVWTRDRARGERIARRLRAGVAYVNDCLVSYAAPAVPAGGLGYSGFGRVRGVAGLEEMSRTHAVLVDRLGLRRELWWFPHRAGVARLLAAALAVRALGVVRGAGEALRRLRARRP